MHYLRNRLIWLKPSPDSIHGADLIAPVSKIVCGAYRSCHIANAAVCRVTGVPCKHLGVKRSQDNGGRLKEGHTGIIKAGLPAFVADLVRHRIAKPNTLRKNQNLLLIS